MKHIFFFILLVMLAACSDENSKPSGQTDLAGIWATDEVLHTNGDVVKMTPGQSIFGVYAESIQIKGNGVYVPVIWQSADRYDFKKTDKGEIVRDGSLLLLTKGTWDMEFSIIKHEADELWLEYRGDFPILGGEGTIYKLKRELNRTSY